MDVRMHAITRHALRLSASTFALACGFAVTIAPSATGSQDVAKWRLAFASEVAGRRGLDIYVTLVPGGTPRRVAGVAGRDDFGPSWSPDGEQIAYRQNPARSDESDIMLVSARGGRPRNLTRSPGVADWSPAWAPDGKLIAFFSTRGGGFDIWTMRPDGREPRQLTRSGFLDEYPSWSPDGKRLVFQTSRSGEFDIYVMGRNGRSQRNLSRHAARDQWASWSPDGRYIAFMSDRDGSEDVFLIHPDGSGLRNVTRTSNLQESHPAWSPTGALTYTRHADVGPIELWAVEPNGENARRLDTAAEPVFVFDWADR
jgi:TolB protein